MPGIKRLTNRGDTIVEVLISIAVVGGLLVTSYAIMNKSTMTIRSNQERSEATRIAQLQIEAISQFVRDGNEEIADIDENGGDGFCIVGDEVHRIAPPAADAADDDFSSEGPYAAHCTQGLYNFAAIKLDTYTYRVYVRWERLGGGLRNEVLMSYRVARI